MLYNQEIDVVKGKIKANLSYVVKSSIIIFRGVNGTNIKFVTNNKGLHLI